jgi:hypothetical protein
MSETMSETIAEAATAARPKTDDADAWKAYWQAQGMPWRTEPDIPADRQAYLTKRRVIVPNIGQGIYPFKGVEPKLTRADIEWLLATHDGGRGPVMREESQRLGLDLRGAYLRGDGERGLDLSGLPLARLRGGLSFAEWSTATREQREQARVHLERALLTRAHLEGARLRETHLEGADVRRAYLDRDTTLDGAILGNPVVGNVFVADVRWGGVNLAVIDWAALSAAGLGDERAARQWTPRKLSADPQTKQRSRKERAQARQEWQAEQVVKQLQALHAAVRSNRQLATALRDQGMNEEADHFAYRAQVVQRHVFRQQGKRGRSLLWGFLDTVAGHGYKPARSLYTYLGVLFGFAFLFFLAGNGWLTFGLGASQYENLPWYEALILSVSSFHGRGFFQPLQALGDPVAIIASVEAIFGLFIEVAFMATFTQRFLGK